MDFVAKLKGLSFKEACQRIEADFNIRHEWKPRVKVKSPETLINERLQQAFDWVFEARHAIRAELRLRGNDIDQLPPIMIEHLGNLDIISAELAGNPARIANGLILLKRRFSLWQQ